MAAKLLDTAQLLVRTGQRDITEIVDVLDAMSYAATLYLEGELHTAFDLTVGLEDIFDVTNDGGYSPQKVLALSNGFVDLNTVVVHAAPDLLSLRDNPALIDTRDYILKADGQVLLYPQIYGATQARGNQPLAFYRVTYTAGFAQTTGLYDQTVVPDWLKELVTQYVIYRMNTQAPFRKTQKTEVKAGEPVLLKAMLNNHSRMFPHAIKPIF